MTVQRLKISTDFSDTPGPRYIAEGPFSGEKFREDILYPKLKEVIDKNEKLVVDLDGTQGYGTSFLEESFGGLIRNNSLPIAVINQHIEVISKEEPYLINDIEEYLNAAADESKK